MNERNSVDSWLRYFRMAKKISTLDAMAERWIKKQPDQTNMIQTAVSHRSNEISMGRLLEAH